MKYFHPENKSKLNLSFCKNELIKLNIHVIIDEENLFKYNPNSEYYTDKCYPYTTENGTDILLNDRHDEFTDLLHNNFTNMDESSNMITMKCYYVLFTKEGLSKNIGNYIIAFITIWFLISGILFFKVGYEFLEEDINKIISLKKKKKKRVLI